VTFTRTSCRQFKLFSRCLLVGLGFTSDF
jgi:hypothetical protein